VPYIKLHSLLLALFCGRECLYSRTIPLLFSYTYISRAVKIIVDNFTATYIKYNIFVEQSMFSRDTFRNNEGNNPKKTRDRKELRIIKVNKSQIISNRKYF